MKLSRFTKIIILAAIITLGLALLFPLVVKMSGKYAVDSGFDSSYDSGGSWDSGSSSSSGSSWDHSSSSNHRNGGTTNKISATFAIFIIVSTLVSFTTVMALIFCICNKKTDSTKVLLLTLFVFLSVIPVVNILATIGALVVYFSPSNSSDNDYNDEDIKKDFSEELAIYGLSPNVVLQQAFASYKRIQIAWMEGNVDSVRDILSDEIYNMYKTQLATLNAKKQKNMMEEIMFKGGCVKGIIEQGDDVALVINLNVTCRDYIINIDNNQVVRGDKNHICDYYYSLTFTFNKNKAKIITNCPNCNAKLPVEGKSVKCEQCGTTIKRKSTNLVMTRKEMISQR